MALLISKRRPFTHLILKRCLIVLENVVESHVPATEKSFSLTLSLCLTRCVSSSVVMGIIFLTFKHLHWSKKAWEFMDPLQEAFTSPQKNAVSSMTWLLKTKVTFVICYSKIRECWDMIHSSSPTFHTLLLWGKIVDHQQKKQIFGSEDSLNSLYPFYFILFIYLTERDSQWERGKKKPPLCTTFFCLFS